MFYNRVSTLININTYVITFSESRKTFKLGIDKYIAICIGALFWNCMERYFLKRRCKWGLKFLGISAGCSVIRQLDTLPCRDLEVFQIDHSDNPTYHNRLRHHQGIQLYNNNRMSPCCSHSSRWDDSLQYHQAHIRQYHRNYRTNLLQLSRNPVDNHK